MSTSSNTTANAKATVRRRQSSSTTEEMTRKSQRQANANRERVVRLEVLSVLIQYTVEKYLKLAKAVRKEIMPRRLWKIFISHQKLLKKKEKLTDLTSRSRTKPKKRVE